jgi:hypothetical protein
VLASVNTGAALRGGPSARVDTGCAWTLGGDAGRDGETGIQADQRNVILERFPKSVTRFSGIRSATNQRIESGFRFE